MGARYLPRLGGPLCGRRALASRRAPLRSFAGVFGRGDRHPAAGLYRAMVCGVNPQPSEEIDQLMVRCLPVGSNSAACGTPHTFPCFTS